ncbi:MAG: DsbA family protein [Myxococcales bacterium]
MSTLRPPLNAQDHVQGRADAPIQLVEYGDYECPFCGRAHLVIKAVQRAMGDDLLFAFRNFPLSQVHPNALRAAQAAEAAALQDRFWPMHDLLYENQQSLEDEHLVRYAGVIGCDLDRFAEDVDSEEVAEKVRSDFLSGARSGVNGTPTFFIDGERYDGPWEPEALLSVLRDLRGVRELR